MIVRNTRKAVDRRNDDGRWEGDCGKRGWCCSKGVQDASQLSEGGENRKRNGVITSTVKSECAVEKKKKKLDG